MISLITTLALAFFSFVCSAFVILRIVIPILPPHPLSRRVSPSEFGLPNFRSLSPADKSHIWLASLDLLALAVFVWQAVSESTGGPSGVGNAEDPLSSVRLWIAMTLRQTCLLIVAFITLLHVRMGRSVSFGAKHWMLWAPVTLLAVTSTGIAGVLSGAGLSSLFIGVVAYSSTVAVLSSVAFVCLIGTLVIIKRNLTAMNEEAEPWPPVRQMEEKPRPSFATEDIDAIRDGASWITSNASERSSRHNSISGWSFSTHHTTVPSHHGHGRPQGALHPSVPSKSSFWFNNTTPHDPSIPPVPPLPAPYGPLSPTSESLSDPDPFRRMPSPLPDHTQRPRFGSQTSWLTSTNGSQVTLSAWSYPTGPGEGSMYNASSPNLHSELLPSTAVDRPITPALSSAQVLGGYSAGRDSERGGLSVFAAPAGTSLDISVYRAIGWLFMIWIPLGLAYPYLFNVLQNTPPSAITSILLILSVTMSSPILALNIIFRSPLPIPTGLFDVRGDLPTEVLRGPSPASTNGTYKMSHEYKRSTSASVTVVEGRRSGDVWMSNGDAVDGKSKFGRAVGMMAPKPKLSVLPTEDFQDGEMTPPLPIQDEDSGMPISLHNRSASENSAQFGRIRKESKASSHFSGGDESLAHATRIMVAQRHYSALAQTLHVSTSPEKVVSGGSYLVMPENGATSSAVTRPVSHIRSRSVSSMSGPKTPTSDSFNISPPPSMPLPPTPPNVRAARLRMHKKSYSSGFSFGAVDDMNEIDALTAGVLPLLVPGLTVGEGMKIKEGHWTPPGTFSKNKDKKLAAMLKEFGEDFSSPEVHSTPARARPRQPRARKTSQHKRNHFSLPSLSLGKDGIHSLSHWSAEVRGALEHKVGQYTATPSNVDIGRRATVFGGEAVPSHLTGLQVLREDVEEVNYAKKGLGRVMSTRSLGLRAEVPHGVDTARSSIASINMMPPHSAASTVTLFEEFEAGLDSGPQAESTPHNTVSRKRVSDQSIPPMPTTSANRRSSIVYIKSDDQVTVTPPNATTTSTMSSFAQWSSRAVRPLMPKSSKLQRKTSNMDSSAPSSSKTDSPGRGLRPLSLLQDRDPNAISASPASPGTRPLLLGKKRSRLAVLPVANDENMSPDAPRSRNRNSLKPLSLGRSETSKMRGVMRRGETLPDVVVRPPSGTEHQSYGYSFRD